jgi:DNA-binding Lrp family transcriptional regulator
LAPQITTLQARILKELLADGRKSDKEIAEEIGETKEAIKKTFRKMEKEGIIQGATTHINYRLFGFKSVAYILVTMDPAQETQFHAYLQKKPEVYAHSNRGVKGQVDIVIILRTLEELNEIKDDLKRNFTIHQMKSAIWTDVKEMNYNLSIVEELCAAPKNPSLFMVNRENAKKGIDAIDQKIADKLAEDGRITMKALAQQIGVSANLVKKRYEKLKADGYLKITIQIVPKKIGYKALCIFFTTISSDNLSGVISQISEIPDIISIMKTSGDFDLQIYAMIQNLEQFLDIKKRIGAIEGISDMEIEINPMERFISWPSPRQYSSTF